MRARTGCFIVMLLPLVLAPRTVPAADAHWSLGPAASWQLFDSDYGRVLHGDPRYGARDGLVLGGRIGHVWGAGLGLELAGGWRGSRLEFRGADVGALHASFGTLDLTWQPAVGSWGAPFVAAGGGGGILYLDDLEPGFSPPWVQAGADSMNNAFYQACADVAVGWRFALSPRLQLRLEARRLFWFRRNAVAGLPGRHESQLFGAALMFGGGGDGAAPAGRVSRNDEDGDGVSNRSDRCPGTPPGARVRRDGCPLDGDGDGVYDGIDMCPDSPRGARVDERGCGRDSDGDGVVDGVDQCEGTPRACRTGATGCPDDADRDGVCDALDQCPNTTAGWQVDERGCPHDSDGDGVPDGADQCAETAPRTKVDVFGCPQELVEREQELVRDGKVLLRLDFETDRAVVLAEFEPTLDLIGQLLLRWPAIRFEIGGHTGNVKGGLDAMTLSRLRADAVRDYLVRRYPALDRARVVAKGYGGTRLLAPETTPANRAKNRRIEVLALDREALRKEAVRRGLLPATPAAEVKRPAPDTRRPAPRTPPRTTTRKRR